MLPHIGPVDFLERPRDEEETRVIALLKNLTADRARETLDAMGALLANAGMGDLEQLFPSDDFCLGQIEGACRARRRHRRACALALADERASKPRPSCRTGEVTRTAHRSRDGRLPRVCCPFGDVEDVGRVAWHAVREAGYDYAFTTLSGTLDASADRFLLPRYGIGRRNQSRLFDSDAARWQSPPKALAKPIAPDLSARQIRPISDIVPTCVMLPLLPESMS